MPVDYQYDVFFSYKRNDLTLQWTRETFKRLTLWITEEIGGEPAKVFVDESVDVGDKWPDSIKHALRNSRCMVALWSPSYFQSSWCVSEWQSFLAREKIAKIAPHGLIAPLKFHDGEHFPLEAKNTEWVDVAPFAVTVSAFWSSAKAIELETELKTFAKGVARMIQIAPTFRPDWPIVERKGTPISKIRLARL